MCYRIVVQRNEQQWGMGRDGGQVSVVSLSAGVATFHAHGGISILGITTCRALAPTLLARRHNSRAVRTTAFSSLSSRHVAAVHDYNEAPTGICLGTKGTAVLECATRVPDGADITH